MHVHTDCGSQFRARRFLAGLRRRHASRGSMGQAALAVGHAAMESLIALLQKNVLNRRRWTTRTELRLAVITWTEQTYSAAGAKPDSDA